MAEAPKMTTFQKIRQLPSKIAREKQKKVVIENREYIREKILGEGSSFQVREAYKALRTNVVFSLPTEGCKKIIVTSSLASEGKSTNCLNLAITFAEMNEKVLIIDCDLRRPNLGRLLNVKNSPGLSNCLVGLSSVSEVIRKSEYANLSYITAGNIPPNPAELLSSPKMEKVINELEKEFDYIFFDTAPINLVTDTAVLSKYVHGVIMVVLQASTDKEALRYAMNQLSFVGTKVLGFVLNGVVYGNNGNYKYKNKKKYYRYGKGNKNGRGSYYKSAYGTYKYSYGGSYGDTDYRR